MGDTPTTPALVTVTVTLSPPQVGVLGDSPVPALAVPSCSHPLSTPMVVWATWDGTPHPKCPLSPRAVPSAAARGSLALSGGEGHVLGVSRVPEGLGGVLRVFEDLGGVLQVFDGPWTSLGGVLRVPGGPRGSPHGVPGVSCP